MRIPTIESLSQWNAARALLTMGLFGFASLPAFADAQSQFVASAEVTATDAAPTFTEDVAPILFESCVSCHNPQGMGPMSLLDYQNARRYASMIRSKVVARSMPPWHLDKTVGIQEYKNDASLSDAEIETIVQWVAAGAPQGDPAKMPPTPEVPDGRKFQLEALLGPPDFTVSSIPYTVLPGQDQWWTPTTRFEGVIDEPRYVRATELKGTFPDGMKVLHHAHAQLQWTDENGKMMSRPLGRQGVGKAGDLFPENTGMLIAPEGEITWGLHYQSLPHPVEDEVATAAVWLYPKGYEPEFATIGEQRFTADRGGDMPWAGDIVIPPNSIKVQQGVHVLEQPAILSSFRPHMHTRGREQSLEVIYPDGRRETLSKVDNFSHLWQVTYQYADHVKPILPKGTMMLITTTWDNTAANPINPDPRQWVVFGQRGVDEMSHAWIGMTYLTDEQYDRLIAERNRVAGLDD